MLNPVLFLFFFLVQHQLTIECVQNVTRARSSTSSTSTKFFFVNDKLDDDEVNSYMSTRLGRIHSSVLPSPSSTYPQSRQPYSGQRQSPALSKSSSLSSRQYSYLLPTSPTGKSNSSSTLANNLSPFLPTSSSSSYLNLVNNNRANNDNNNNQANPEGENNDKVSKLKEFDELDDLSWVQPVYRPNVSTTTPVPTSAAPTISTVSDGLVLNYQKAPSPPSIASSSSSWPVLTNRTISSASTHHQTPPNLSTNRSGSNAHNNLAGGIDVDADTLPSRLANISFALRDEQWVAPIIALSVLNMLVIFGFECFVIYRACK